MTILIQAIAGSGGHDGSPSCWALCYRIRKSEEAVLFMLIGNDVAKRRDERGKRAKRKGEAE